MHSKRRPRRHAIGIEKGWEAKGGHPFDHLVSLDAFRLATHGLIVGATGSGKTNLIHHVVAGEALAGRSMVVLDMRGDLVAAVLRILAAAGTDPRLVEAIDLREKDRPAGWNPLGGEGEAYFAALGVLDAIEAEHKELGVQLAETLRYALMLLAECGEPLTRLEALFYDGGFLRSCIERCVSENVAAFWERFDALSPDRRQALAMPVVNKVSMLFATEGLRRTFGHPSPIDLRRHLDTPGSVLLVSLACDELHAAGRMAGRMLLAAIWRAVSSRVGVPEARRNRVLLVVDEFENFAGRDFESILAEGRRFGLSLLASHQTLAQLSPRTRSILLGNVGVKVAFRLGREDSATMSRDMTGDPKGLDLASLPTGECAMWTRDGKVRFVEVNQPIVRGGGPLTPRARDLLRAIRARSGPAFVPAEPVARADAERDPSGTAKRATVRDPARANGTRAGAKTDLEDWLS